MPKSSPPKPSDAEPSPARPSGSTSHRATKKRSSVLHGVRSGRVVKTRRVQEDHTLPTTPSPPPWPQPHQGKRWLWEQNALLLERRAVNDDYKTIARDLGRSELACRLHIMYMNNNRVNNPRWHRHQGQLGKRVWSSKGITKDDQIECAKFAEDDDRSAQPRDSPGSQNRGMDLLMEAASIASSAISSPEQYAEQDSRTALPQGMHESVRATPPQATQGRTGTASSQVMHDSVRAAPPQANQGGTLTALPQVTQDIVRAIPPQATQGGTRTTLPQVMQGSTRTALSQGMHDSVRAVLPQANQGSTLAALPQVTQDIVRAMPPQATQGSARTTLPQAMQDSTGTEPPATLEPDPWGPRPFSSLPGSSRGRDAFSRSRSMHETTLPSFASTFEGYLSGGQRPRVDSAQHTPPPVLPPIVGWKDPWEDRRRSD